MYFVFFFRNVIEHFYLKFNRTTVIFTRDFKDLSYFEKIFLAFFHRKNLFKDSIANIDRDDSLVNFRKDNFPLIFFFHLYFDKADYTFSDLKILKKYFFYFKKSKLFSKTLNHFKKLFFIKHNYIINNFIMYLIIQKIFFKRYYNLCDSIYFDNFNKNNLVKLNLLFFLLLNNSKGLLHIYDLSKYDDWYTFNFNIKPNNKNIKPKEKKKISNLYKEYTINRKKYLFKVYKKYNSFLKVFIKNFKSLYTFSYKNNVVSSIKIKLNSLWVKTLTSYYPIRFSETSLSKHINLNNINTYNFFFIRKNRIFNKGRYSRNRQLYRTGVYWCLWLNIMLVYGLYFMFYRFTFNFGYFWWGLLILAYSTIFSRVVKYNFFNFFYVKKEILMFFKWFGLILLNFKTFLIGLLNYFIYKNYVLNLFINKNNLFLLTIGNYFNDFVIFFRNLLIFKNYGKFVYFWESLNQKDESFLKHKTVMHWFVQFYKLMTY